LKKIAQRVAQSFLCHLVEFFAVKNSNKNLRYILLYFSTKLPKGNHRPKGENSPSLVTLTVRLQSKLSIFAKQFLKCQMQFFS
jgi:hypothetical protein